MKKKLLCLMLSMLMLLGCFLTACGSQETEEEGDKEVVDTSAKTIVMWVVTNKETTPEAEKKVNEAFTKITKAKFKTNVVLKFCTEDEYYEKLEEAINANQAEILLKAEHDKALRVYLRAHKDEVNENGVTKTKDELTADFYEANPKYAKYQNAAAEDAEEETVAEDETFENEFGIVEIKYPEAKENQVDIFYLSGYDKYMQYYNNEWLSSLSEELKTSSKKITHYVSKSLLDGVQIEGGVYAIPNNVAIGEYTYMMIDKELFDDYYQKIDNVQSVLDLGTFLNDVQKYNGDLSSDDPNYVVPLASSFEECMSSLVWYWQMFYTDQSVYETKLDPNGRNYVINKFYEVKEEAVEEGQEGKVKIYSTYAVQPDVAYAINGDGKLVDEDGNVLNYTYVQDTSVAWYTSVNKDGEQVLEAHFPTSVEPEKKNNGEYEESALEGTPFTYYKDAKNNVDKKKLVYDGCLVVFEKEVKGMYLVDENGTPVTPENDKRVVIDKETKADAYGNQQSTYYYGYEKTPDFSVLGALQTKPANRTRGGISLGFNSLFTQSNYRDLLTKLLSYEYNGYYGEVKEGQHAAVSFVKGDARIKLEYEENGVYVDPDTGREYYAMVSAYPQATEEELYGNMFAVYANSAHLSRSMRIITYLNTNTEFRNLLQYGIEGQHYELEKVIEKDELGIETEKHIVTLLPGNEEYGVYSMDVEKTGNCFIVTPTKEMGGANAWDYAKIQNNDSLVNPLMGFDFNVMLEDAEYGLDVELIAHINELNQETWLKIKDCEDADDLKELIENSTNGLMKILAASAGDPKLKKAVNGSYDPNMPLGPDAGDQQPVDLSGHSPYAIYNSWLTQYGYAP